MKNNNIKIAKQLIKLAKELTADSNIIKECAIKNGDGYLYIKIKKDSSLIKDIQDIDQKKRICSDFFQNEIDNLLKKSYQRKDIYLNPKFGEACYIDEWSFNYHRPFINVLEIEVNLFGTEATRCDVDDNEEGEITLSAKKAEKIFINCAKSCGFIQK